MSSRSFMRVTLQPGTGPAAPDLHPVRRDDIPELGALMHRSYAGTVDDEGESEQAAQAEVARTLDGDYGSFDAEASCVRRVDGRIRSAALLTRFQGAPFVAFSITDAGYKGRGLGRSCLQAAMARLAARGESELRLVVTLANTPAVALYRSLGFDVEDRSMAVRRLRAPEAAAYRDFRLAALLESPAAFGSSHEEESLRPVAAFEALLCDGGEERAFFGRWHGATLVGAVGVGREQGLKERHVGFICSLYVAPAARRQGVARALLHQAVAHAQAQPGLRQLVLSVTATQAAAVALYAACGFQACGRMPRALHVDGVFHDELMMVRRLDDAAG
ncbi:MAG: N-acetyltransferase family protein [Aquabacterium sp.]